MHTLGVPKVKEYQADIRCALNKDARLYKQPSLPIASTQHYFNNILIRTIHWFTDCHVNVSRSTSHDYIASARTASETAQTLFG